MKDHPHCFLCTHCLTEWQPAINTHARLCHFKRGQQIFQEQETVTGFYFLHSGKVKVHKHWGKEGKELIIKFAGEGDILGHRGMGTDNTYPVSATSVEEVTACFISPEFFKTTMKVNGSFAYELVVYYAGELQRAEQNMRDMVHRNVKSRIANSLIQMQQIFGRDSQGNIGSTLSRQDIASFAGTTYETLFKTLNEWVGEQLIELSGKQIRIVKEQQLLALIE